MKLKALSIAVAASSLLAGAAHAIVPNAASGFEALAVSANAKLYAAGASAQDGAVIGHVLSNLCVSDRDLYTDRTPAQITAGTFVGSNDTSVACVVSESALGADLNGNGNTADSAPFLFRKLTAGGSANGVIPVANGTPATAASRAINTSNCQQVGATHTVLGTPGVRVWSCGTAGQQAVIPTVGLADVEPELFAEGGPNAIGSFNLANIDTLPTLSLTFGVPVTLNLRNALQQAQGLTSGSDALADMPSLTSAQLTSLYSGKIGSWNSFENAAGAKLPALATVGPVNDRVHVCRRTVGSGTQATVNALFLSNPCGPGRIAPAVDNTAQTATDGTGNYATLPFGGAAAIHELASSGGVNTCLDTLQTQNRWGIGIQTLEQGNNNWRFIKVDGYAPTLENVAANKYSFWAENVITVRSNQAANSVSRAFFTGFRPAQDLAELNATFNPRITEVSASIANGRCDNGETCVGYLYPFNYTGGAVPAPFQNSVPTMSATRAGLSGQGAPSMCRPSIIQTDSVL